MKRSLFILALAAIGLTGCDEEILFGGSEGQAQSALSESLLTAQARANFLYRSLDQTMRDSTFQATDSTTVEGAIATRTSNGDILLDFGNGAVGSDGLTRSGQVRFSDIGQVPYTSTGAAYSLSFSNYQVEGEPVSGSFSVENKGNNSYGLALNQFSVEPQTGFNATQEVQWDSGFATISDLSDDLYSLSGSADFTDSTASRDIAANLSSPLKVDRSCNFGVTQGVLDVTFTGDSLTYSQGSLDFLAPDGCNNVVELSLTDGSGNEIVVPISFEGF